MKKFTAIFLAILLCMSLCVQAFCIEDEEAFPDEAEIQLQRNLFTVLYSEVTDEGAQSMFLADDAGSVYSFLLKEGDYEVKSDGTYRADSYYKSFKNKETLQAGTVLFIEYETAQLIYPEKLSGVKSVTFTSEMPLIAADEASRILDDLNELNETDRFKLVENELIFPVRKYFTVLSSYYDVSGSWNYLASDFSIHYSVSLGKDQKYYLTAPETIYFEDDTLDQYYRGGVGITDDGSKKGIELKSMLLKREEIPAGTVVELLINPTILESYPPVMGVYEIKFTDKLTGYTLKEAESEINSINEMGYEYPAAEDEKAFSKSETTACVREPEDVSENFTVIVSEGYAMYLRGADGEIMYLNTDFRGSKIKLACRGETMLKTAEKFSKDGVLPVGTVINVTHSEIITGSVLNTDLISKITVTSKKETLTDAEITEYLKDFDIGNSNIMLVHNGMIYVLEEGAFMFVELSEDAKTIKAVYSGADEPFRDGTQNFSEEPVEYVVLVDGASLAVYYDDGCRFFVNSGRAAKTSADITEKAWIYHDGTLYLLNRSFGGMEIPQDAKPKTVGTAEYCDGDPEKNDTQNFSRKPAAYGLASVNEKDCLYAFYDGDWRFFEAVEQASD